MKNIRSHGVDTRKVVAVQGVFSESLTDELKERHKLERAAIIHVDCDLYQSTVDVLRFIEGLVRQGTILIFDDWHEFDHFAGPKDAANYGEQRAFQEWSMSNEFTEFYHFWPYKAFIKW